LDRFLRAEAYFQVAVAFVSLSAVLYLQIGALRRHGLLSFGLLVSSSVLGFGYFACNVIPLTIRFSAEQYFWLRCAGAALHVSHSTLGVLGAALLFRDYRSVVEKLAKPGAPPAP
jgi:hypothetical protein